jgi:hypothetical protein
MKGQPVLKRHHMNFIPDPINVVSTIIIIIITNFQGKSGTLKSPVQKKLGQANLRKIDAPTSFLPIAAGEPQDAAGRGKRC